MNCHLQRTRGVGGGPAVATLLTSNAYDQTPAGAGEERLGTALGQVLLHGDHASGTICFLRLTSNQQDICLLTNLLQCSECCDIYVPCTGHPQPALLKCRAALAEKFPCSLPLQPCWHYPTEGLWQRNP